MDIRVARLSRVSADNAPGHLPGSFFVLGEGECAHWAALALMACLREQGLRIAQDRLTYWKSVGAQASPTVERLIKQAAKAAA